TAKDAQKEFPWEVFGPSGPSENEILTLTKERQTGCIGKDPTTSEHTSKNPDSARTTRTRTDLDGGKSDDLPYMGPVVAVPDLGPDALDEHGVPRGAAKTAGPPLTQGQARDLAKQYYDKAVAEHETGPSGDVNSGRLDGWLRGILRTELGHDEVEAAFRQIM